jgi:peptidylprolyl isomerase
MAWLRPATYPRDAPPYPEEISMALERPKVDPEDGPPPADLVIEDVTVGDGPEVKPGQVAIVQYVGASFATGREFDASWNRGEPFSFPLGGGRVIAGWDQGVAGMRVGGRRKLVIPPHLAYGDRGAGGAIKPGETLVFIVDLVGAR